MAITSFAEAEIASQRECWVSAVELGESASADFPLTGERVAVIGCGTSWFIAQAYASLRETSGQGETDAFAASEAALSRKYDRIVVITRSGTTTEILRAMHSAGTTPILAVTASTATPAAEVADQVIALDFADEKSVVQTRFATSALMLLRASLGLDVNTAIRDVERALDDSIEEFTAHAQFTFLGAGWTYGLALEAALKMREASGAWAEAYPAMEYRHGPISVTNSDSLVWMMGDAPEHMDEDVTAAGGQFVTSNLDPLADLVRAQRLAIRCAHIKGLDPDRPRNLTRSVILRAT